MSGHMPPSFHFKIPPKHVLSSMGYWTFKRHIGRTDKTGLWLADWLASIRKNRKWNLVEMVAVFRYLCSLIPDFFNIFYCPNSPKRLLQFTLLKRTITLVINSYEFPLFIFRIILWFSEVLTHIFCIVQTLQTDLHN